MNDRKLFLSLADWCERQGDLTKAWSIVAEIANSSSPKDTIHQRLIALEHRMNGGVDEPISPPSPRCIPHLPSVTICR
jgi:hypothetical protein